MVIGTTDFGNEKSESRPLDTQRIGRSVLWPRNKLLPFILTNDETYLLDQPGNQLK